MRRHQKLVCCEIMCGMPICHRALLRCVGVVRELRIAVSQASLHGGHRDPNSRPFRLGAESYFELRTFHSLDEACLSGARFIVTLCSLLPCERWSRGKARSSD